MIGSKLLTADDPLSPIRWDASVSTLALQKLMSRSAICREEKGALERVMEFLKDVSTANQLRPEDFLIRFDMLTSSLMATYCSTSDLVSQVGVSVPTTITQTIDDLDNILSGLKPDHSSDIDVGTLERTQNACLEILENANRKSAVNDSPTYIDLDI